MSKFIDTRVLPTARLIDAIGGGERIGAVRTFVRETVRRVRRVADPFDSADEAATGATAAQPGRSCGSHTPQVLSQSRAGGASLVSEETLCVTTYRSAGGRMRIETRSYGDDEEYEPEPDVLIVPHAVESGTDSRIVSPAEDRRAAAALRDARLEPRNLLAHLHERPASLRSLPDGLLEIALAEEPVVYLFDLGSGLCAKRLDQVSGDEAQYFGWLRIDGIATPLREIRRRAAEVWEERIIAAAYDVPLADELFVPLH